MINRECFLKQFKKYNGDTIRLWLTSDDILIIPDTLEEDPYFLMVLLYSILEMELWVW